MKKWRLCLTGAVLAAACRDHTMAFSHETPRDGRAEPGRCAGHEYDHGSVSGPEKTKDLSLPEALCGIAPQCARLHARLLQRPWGCRTLAGNHSTLRDWRILKLL